MLAGRAEEIFAARHLDQLGHPVARRHQRVQPFDAGDARPLAYPARARGDRVHPCAQLADDGGAARRLTERAGGALDVGEDVAQAVRLERDDPRALAQPSRNRLLDVALAHRAYFALRLRDDYVWRQLAQLAGVHPIDGQRIADDPPHLAIDVGARSLGVELGRGEHGQALDPGRVVALMRAADQVGFKAERAYDLGRARQQAYDSMHARLPDAWGWA